MANKLDFRPRKAATSLADEFLTQHGITAEANQIDQHRKYFEADSQGNLIIRYTSWKNPTVAYSYQASRRTKRPYIRTRLAKPISDQAGKTVKYLSPHGSGLAPFFGGINAYFPGQEAETLFITEGEKKAFAQCRHGVYSVGIAGIHAFAKTIRDKHGRKERLQVLPELAAFIKVKKPKNLVLLLDADAVHNFDNPDRLVDFISCIHRFRDAFAPFGCRLYFCHLLDNPERAKGIDDLYLAYQGGEREITRQQLALQDGGHFRFIDLQKVDKTGISDYFHACIDDLRPDYRLNIDRYLGEQQLELDQILEQNDRLIIKAPTGTGKTEFTVQYAFRHHRRMIIVLPYLVLTQQSYTRFRELGICVVDGTVNEPTEIGNARAANIVAVTWDSLHKILPGFGIETLLVVDEFHDLVQQHDFRSMAAETVFQTILNFENVVLLSATPEMLFREEGFKMLSVEAQQMNRPVLHRVDYGDEGSAPHVYSLLASRTTGKVILRLLNRERLDNIAQALIRDGLAQPEEIARVYNRDLLVDDDHYRHLVEHQRFPDHVKYILCTSKLTDGSQILNPDVEMLIFVDEDEPRDVVQFINRTRNVTQLKAFCLRKQQSQPRRRINKLNKFKEFKDYAQKVIRANQAIDEVLQSHPEEDLLPININTAFSLDSKFIREGSFNFLRAAHEANKQFIGGLSLDGFYEEVRRFAPNITVVAGHCIPVEWQTLSGIRRESKNAREDARELVYQMMLEREDLFFESLAHLTRNRTLKKRILAAFKIPPVQGLMSKLFTKDNLDFFKAHDHLILKESSKYLFLKQGFDELLTAEQRIALIRRTESFTRFKNQIKIAFGFFIYQHHRELLTREQRGDIRRLLKDVETIVTVQHDIGLLSLLTRLNQHRKHKAEKLNTRQVYELVHNLCPDVGTYRDKTPRKTTIYRAETLQILTLESVLKQAGITEANFIDFFEKRLHNLLENSASIRTNKNDNCYINVISTCPIEINIFGFVPPLITEEWEGPPPF